MSSKSQRVYKTLKKRGRRSTAWNHFSDTEQSGKVKCKYCGHLVAVAGSSTGNLIRHLQRHVTNRALPPSAPQQNPNPSISPAEPAEALPGPGSEVITPTSSAAESATALGAVTVAAQSAHIQSANTYLVKPVTTKKSSDIDKQLVRMITKEYHPFSLVEGPEFKKLLHLLCPSYNLPSKKTLTTILIPAEYNVMREKVTARLKRAHAVCITVDGWTTGQRDCFISMTAHYIVEKPDKTILASDLLGCIAMPEQHTAQNMCAKMKDVLDHYNLGQRVAVVVTDNAHNMKAALRHGGWRFWECFAHSLNLIIQSGVLEIDTTLNKVRATVTFFRRSAYAAAQLKSTQEGMGLSILKLKIDVSTHWNSTMLMMQRFVASKTAILSTLEAIKDGPHQASSPDLKYITKTEWITIEQTIELLEIFGVVTQAISAENNVTASTIILFHKQICQHLTDTLSRPELMSATQRVAEKIQQECASRFENLEDTEMVAQCTILDPRFKKLGFTNDSKYANALSSLIGKVSCVNLNCDAVAEALPTVPPLPSMETDSSLGRGESLLWKNFDNEAQKHMRPENATASAVVEINKYIEEPYLPRQQDPLVWWHQRRTVYPRLYQFMKTRLCMMATSVPSERIFSKAGQIVTEKRTRLKSCENVEKSVFLAYNLGNID